MWERMSFDLDESTEPTGDGRDARRAETLYSMPQYTYTYEYEYIKVGHQVSAQSRKVERWDGLFLD